MLSTLLIIGIVASTFLTGLYLDPFLPMIVDARAAKAFICWVICLLIGAVGLKSVEIRRKNTWATVFVFYAILTVNMHPPFRLHAFGVDLNGFWIYPTIVQMMGFYLMFLVIANAQLDLPRIYKTIFYCGFASALYVFVQAAQADQLFVLESPDVVMGTKHAELTSFMGQSTLAAAFIAMTIPFGLYLKRYFFMAIMAVAVVLTGGKMAIASLAIGGWFYFVLTSRNHPLVLMAILGAVLVFFGVLYLHSQGKLHDISNGRASHWMEVWKDFNSPQVVDDVSPGAPQVIKDHLQMANSHTWQLTGIGPGAYQYVFVAKHDSPWVQIHNEYLEVLYGWGWIGFVIFCFGWMCLFARGVIAAADVERSVLVTSFVIVSLNAITNFVWQVEPMRFLTVLIAGLLTA